jgi:hypothetical protein
MPNAAAGGFAVRPDELLGLAQGVAFVRADLEATRELAHDLAGATGSAELSHALEHFVAGWRDGRRQISTEIGALSDMLAQAAAAYTDTEDGIADAMAASGAGDGTPR